MLVEAMVEKGQVRLLSPLQLKNDYLVVKMEIPEDEIVFCYQKVATELEPLKQTEEVAEFQSLTNVLFGEGYYYVPEKSDQEILGEILSEKYA